MSNEIFAHISSTDLLGGMVGLMLVVFCAARLISLLRKDEG